MALPKVYLAGPDVFLPDPLARAAELREICRRHGLDGRFPLDPDLDLSGLDKRSAGLAIGRANEELIRGCAGVLANLTPFRGPSADVGTAFEVGFARALGKPIVGYTESDAGYRERIARVSGPERTRPDGGLEDAKGMGIEDFDLVDNLMLETAVAESGGRIVRPRDVTERGVSVFELAARALAALMR